MSHYIVEKRAENFFSIFNSARKLIASVPSLDTANLICNALNAQDAAPAAVPELRGEFVRIDVHADAQPANYPNNPFTVMHTILVGELARVVVPVVTVTPQPDQFEDVADYLVRTVRTFDRWFKSVGLEVKSNTTSRVDMTIFTDVFYAAIEGEATHTLDGLAEDLREEYGEAGLERGRDRCSFAEDLVVDLRRMTKTLYGV